MILAVVVLLAISLRFACGVSLRTMDDLRIRGEAPFVLSLVLVVAFPVLAALLRVGRQAVVPVWLMLMAVLLSLCLMNAAGNRGFRVMAAGVALNMLAIAANGHMPVSGRAAVSIAGAAADLAVKGGDLFHSAVEEGTRLSVMSDVLPLPGLTAFRSILSIGDVMMFVGILLVLVGAPCSSRRAPVSR